MPSTTKKQANYMSALAHGWSPPGKHPSLKVAKEFHEADKREGKYEHAYAGGGKVSGLLDLIKTLSPTARTRMEQMFDLGPDIAKYIRPSTAKALAVSNAPLSIMHPDEFLSLARSGDEDVAKRAARVLPLIESRGLEKSPYLGVTNLGVDDGNLRVNLHQGRARSTAIRDMGYNSQPVQIFPGGPASLESDPVGWLNKYSSVYPEDKSWGKDVGPVTMPKTFATGGSVDETNKTQKGLDLISHAADRATAWLNSTAGHPPAEGTVADPHRIAARVAAGLGSQVLGLDERGRPQLGRTPGLVKEALAIPAGLTDIGDALGSRLPVIRDALARLHEKYGADLAPGWSRSAEASADQTHQAVRAAMGLGAPRGAAENLAEAGGTMLGQLPVGAARAGEGVLAKLARSPLEWLGPTIRPSVANYGVGTLAGGIMGAAGDDPAPPQGLQGHAEGGKVDMLRRGLLKGIAGLTAAGAIGGEKMLKDAGHAAAGLQDAVPKMTAEHFAEPDHIATVRQAVADHLVANRKYAPLVAQEAVNSPALAAHADDALWGHMYDRAVESVAGGKGMPPDIANFHITLARARDASDPDAGSLEFVEGAIKKMNNRPSDLRGSMNELFTEAGDNLEAIVPGYGDSVTLGGFRNSINPDFTAKDDRAVDNRVLPQDVLDNLAAQRKFLTGK